MILKKPFLSVTPSLDGDVLARVSRATDWLSVPQIHALLPERSDEGIRNTLSRLVQYGLLLEKVFGRSRVFSLNRDHLLASAVVDIAEAQERFLDRLGERCASWNSPPVFAALFGSAARGEMTAESDIDLFIVQPHNTDDDTFSEQIDGLCAEASRWTGNDVQALVIPEKSLIGAKEFEPVLSDIEREGLFFIGDRDTFSPFIERQ
jgi:predicted nucleotidyltransferase